MAVLRLLRREPTKAYVSNMLWLPKRLISTGSLKSALQYFSSEPAFRCDNCGRALLEEERPKRCCFCGAKGHHIKSDSVATIKPLWEETEDHLIIPREFLSSDNYPQFRFPFIDTTPKQFPRTGIRTNIVLSEKKKQPQAFAAFRAAQNGVLNLAPGRGKTVLALKKLETMSCPGLIVVHNTYLMEQWKERIAQFVEFPVGQQLGVIQGQEFDWQRPLTIAMIHSLANRAKAGEIPPDFSSWFGAVFFDEVHHLSAPTFVTAARLISGNRYGLTATDKRTDGLEFIYQYHIGKVFYSDTEAGIIPRVYFQQTPSKIDMEDESVKDKTGSVHIGKLRGALSAVDQILDFRKECIQEALDQGRKVLAVGHSKELLIKLSDHFPGSGLIIQDTPQKERTGIVQSSRITFAINQLGVEGLDDDFIDALFFLTPFKNENDLIQALGRIQRHYEGKKTPVVVVFDDVYIDPLHKLCHKLRAVMQEKGIKYQNLLIPPKWR